MRNRRLHHSTIASRLQVVLRDPTAIVNETGAKMTEQQTLLKTILSLIGMRTEGPLSDFKLQLHDKNANLIHEVSCLANAD